LAEHRQLVVLRGRVTEQLEVLLRGRAIAGLAAAAAATGSASAAVVLDGHVGRGPGRRGLRIWHGPTRIMGHGVTGTPEVRSLVETGGRCAAVDRSPLRHRPLQFASADASADSTTAAAADFHHRVGVLVVQVRGGLENVSGHVQRPEVRLQRVHGRLQGQQQLGHVTLYRRRIK